MFLLITHAAKEDHIIAVQPIWTAPYNFRYMPMRGCQSNHYNQPGGYGTQPNTYGQPGGYGAQSNTYGQPGGYGAQLNIYGQFGHTDTYGQTGNYGTQPDNRR